MRAGRLQAGPRRVETPAGFGRVVAGDGDDAGDGRDVVDGVVGAFDAADCVAEKPNMSEEFFRG